MLQRNYHTVLKIPTSVIVTESFKRFIEGDWEINFR